MIREKLSDDNVLCLHIQNDDDFSNDDLELISIMIIVDTNEWRNLSLSTSISHHYRVASDEAILCRLVCNNVD